MRRIQQHRQRSDPSNNQGDGGKEAKDALRSVQGRVHLVDTPVQELSLIQFEFKRE
jgi:hypothetical protein